MSVDGLKQTMFSRMGGGTVARDARHIIKKIKESGGSSDDQVRQLADLTIKLAQYIDVHHASGCGATGMATSLMKDTRQPTIGSIEDMPTA